MRLLGCERVEQLGPQHVSFRLLLPFILYLNSATGQHSRGGTADLRWAPRARLHPLSIPCEALGSLDSAFSSICVIVYDPHFIWNLKYARGAIKIRSLVNVVIKFPPSTNGV
jgi:hypothetical protein